MNKPLNGLKAVGYVRVSTDKQANEGVSLDSQLEKIQAMAVIQDSQLLEVIQDAESAKSLDRPGMVRLLAMVDAGEVQVVIIGKLDRLTRSVADLGELLKRFEWHGVALVSLAESLDTSSASGRLVLRIMTSVSEWEREAIAERTATAMQYKRAHLQVYNHSPTDSTGTATTSLLTTWSKPSYGGFNLPMLPEHLCGR
jgi:site-specific DNA recombinase